MTMHVKAVCTRGRLFGAGVLCLAAACGAAGVDRSGEGIRYAPADSVIRLSAMPLEGDDIGLVRDFELVGDTVYLLDVTGRVIVVERGSAGLRLAGQFGRAGAGPGELQRATAIALAGRDIAVLDGTRIHRFDRAGGLISARPVTMPCAMMRPSITSAADGILLSGACLERGVVTDTMRAVLAWSADTVTWNVVASVPRFTSDGSVGTVFGAGFLLTPGPDGQHAFGGGETNCVWTITDRGGRPDAAASCPAARDLYSADPPAGLEARMRSARFAGMRMKWPETLPVYMDRFLVGDRIVLVRPFAADSVVLQTAHPESADLAVAPLNGLIGCKSAGCLWLFEETDVPHVIVLDRTRIEAMVARGT